MVQVACDPQARNIASIDDKGNLFCWNLEKDKEKPRFDPQQDVSILSFSCEGRHLAYGDKQGKIHLFDLKNNKAVLKWDGHEQPVNAMIFSPDGKSLITAGQEGRAKLWQLE